MLIENGLIKQILTQQEAQRVSAAIDVVDCSKYVVTPSLIDCHTHLLEFAPASIYGVTKETYGLGGQALLLQALSNGITALGEQICGFPTIDLTLSDIRKWSQSIPMDICFSLSSISIGFNNLLHFSASTRSQSISQERLMEEEILNYLVEHSEYPGENLFINATPANFTEDVVPNAGAVIYKQQELVHIANLFHQAGKKIGAHVGGETAIRMALDADFDVLHHAHGISDQLIEQARQQQVSIVATPIGGTHLVPNSPEEISCIAMKGINIAISTDAYLPIHPNADWIPNGNDGKLLGPESLLLAAHPAMKLLYEKGWDENAVLSLITRNAAQIMGRDGRYGQLSEGMEANFLVSPGLPGLEITNSNELLQVYYKGVKVMDRG
ncbi:amidohydrolase family protein [Paenibacillus sp. 1_12]|uniref:amidohydrolase family protein n=1 Tax=Paenibacillus sp. 1_12 TaxID=1566278 RepID=UPI0015A57465|nr:amidohydrolase family protein [Paenibacillus sp. 1_12]